MTDATRFPPGRNCPLAYRYEPRVFDRPPEIEAETIYVVGGLYGNVEALDEVLEMSARDRSVILVFNGDFHWFDIALEDYDRVSDGVAAHIALRGNIETEIVDFHARTGCGCSYPASVSNGEVARSNDILLALRQTARQRSGTLKQMKEMPMHRVAQVGNARIGIVHGDWQSLSGWGFGHEAINDPENVKRIDIAFRQARVDVFASTHTCLPVMRAFHFGDRRRVVANNGAAGMPNFQGELHGLITRISIHPARHSAYGVRVRDSFRKLPRRVDSSAVHDSILSRNGVSGNPGANQHRDHRRAEQ